MDTFVCWVENCAVHLWEDYHRKLSISIALYFYGIQTLLEQVPSTNVVASNARITENPGLMSDSLTTGRRSRVD